MRQRHARISWLILLGVCAGLAVGLVETDPALSATSGAMGVAVALGIKWGVLC